jgi:hypothetical protein
MISTFFLAELKYTVKQPLAYVFLFVFGLFTYFAVVSDNVQIGGSIGNIYENSPYTITMYVTSMSLFGLLVATAFFNNAALRDHRSDFQEIMFSTPLSRPGYFFGRFFGALIMSTVPMIGVFVGVIAGSAIGPAIDWIEPERIGPFYLSTFINNYLLFILPNMFFAGAVIYAFATKWKSTVVSFVGALCIIVAYMIAGTLMSDLDNERIGALLDSFGIRAYFLDTKYFTPQEKNTLGPAFSGVLLLNRLIWIAVGAIILLLSYWSFSFKEKAKKVKAIAKPEVVRTSTLYKPSFSIDHEKAAGWVHFKSFYRINFLNIVKSNVFKIILVFCGILLFANLKGGFEYFGLQAYPLTYKMIGVINSVSGLFIMIILVFFSGELIWRDRDHKINEVVDSTPHLSFISLMAKTLSLVSIVTLLHFAFISLSILYQLMDGFTRIELDVYLIDFFVGQLPGYLVLSGLLIFIQVIFNNKYIGYFASLVFLFVWGSIMAALDISSNMVVIGGTPSLMYSDMNGFGPGLNGAYWFNVYWLLFGALLLLLSGLIWNRGVLRSLMQRLRNIRQEISRSYTLAIVVIGCLWIVTAGFVYYNTQVLNDYISQDDREEIQVEYERTYKKYEKLDLPKVTSAKYEIDIHPSERDVFVKGVFNYMNEGSLPIDTLVYSYDSDWSPVFDIPDAQVVLRDSLHQFIIFRLNKPIPAGGSIPVEIHTSYVTSGFENQAGNTSIVRNGTFLNNMQILPALGYQQGGEINDKNKRRSYDLPPKKSMPDLQHVCNSACGANYLTDGLADFVPIETIISTSSDQIAIAPGSLVKEWQQDGRNYYHYKVDHVAQLFCSFISARFEVQRRKWKDVDIEVYYDAKHGVNVERMMDAVERSLDYYSTNFGPYYHKQCRIIEFPRYASFAQAFPGTMPYSEAIGFIINLEDEDENNIVDAVIAHEMAHQWWAHQVIGANMQGSTMLSESFAEYSSLMTMKKISPTPMKMREFLKYDHSRYLRGRSGEVDKELPLSKVENQQHIHYGKGSVILFALQDYIGEQHVNRAMQGFLEEYRYKGPPYPTSLDFLRYLEPEVPDSLSYLLDDWFHTITLYDNRVKEATYKALGNGKYQVEMLVHAEKVKSDSMGNETKLPINDWIDIGAFSDDDEEELIYQQRVRVSNTESTFTFVLDTIPARVGIDPRHLLIDRVFDDNIKAVSLAE